MKPFLRATLIAGLFTMTARVATAQTLTDTVHLTNPGSPFAYTMFSVAAGGPFNIYTTSTTYNLTYGGGGGYQTDPMFLLFSGSSSNGAGLGQLLYSQDDGYGACGSTNDRDSCLSGVNLAAGDYTVATSLWYISESDARTNTYAPPDGAHYQWTDASFNVTVHGDGLVEDLGFSAQDVSAAPEPATLTLMATGLLGMFGVARRRLKTKGSITA